MSVSFVAVQRRAVVAVAADDRVLLGNSDPIPELHQHPDQPHHHEGAAHRPVGLAGILGDPDQVLVLARVDDAVLVAEQVARRARRPGPRVEAHDLPLQLHLAAGGPGDVAQRVVDGVGGQRDRAATAGRRRSSPDRGCRSENTRIGFSPRGFLAVRPNLSMNRPLPSASVTVSWSGGASTPSTRCRRWAPRTAAVLAAVCTSEPSVQRLDLGRTGSAAGPASSSALADSTRNAAKQAAGCWESGR